MQKYSLVADIEAVSITARAAANPEGTLYLAADVDARDQLLMAKLRNVAGWLNNGCEPAKAAAELLLIAGLPTERSL